VPTFGEGKPAPSAQQVAAREYFDLTGVFRLLGRYSFRLGVRNILDREPPVVPAGNSGSCGGCNGNTWPQLYDPLGRYMFAGVTIDLDPHF
jgi:outer membrane receptor protein involved in Fe transport